MRIELDDLTRPAVHALLEEHLTDMYATSPPESVHALDLTALTSPDVTVWTLWDGGTVLGCAALKELGDGAGEVKSMRTSAAARRRGVASRLLAHLLEQARARGLTSLWLETGTQPFFAPARELYSRHGFVPCPPFGSYQADPHSAFMTLELDPATRLAQPAAGTPRSGGTPARGPVRERGALPASGRRDAVAQRP